MGKKASKGVVIGKNGGWVIGRAKRGFKELLTAA